MYLVELTLIVTGMPACHLGEFGKSFLITSILTEVLVVRLPINTLTGISVWLLASGLAPDFVR